MNTKTSKHRIPFRKASYLTLFSSLLVGVSACNDSDSNGGGSNNSPNYEEATFILANNGSTNAGTIDMVDQDIVSQASFTTGANEGVALDVGGNLYQAADLTTNALRVACTIGARENGAAFDTGLDREIAGVNTGLLNPKGIAIAQEAGYVLVANFNASQISVFGTTATGNVAPVATTDLAAAPWDLVLDEMADRLFVALTDGTIAVFDNFIASGMNALTADRIITPADSNGVKISVNSHGIAYDLDSDRLVVSDVGSAADATDGALFVLEDASTASGLVSVQRQISGPASMLGNPVDIVLSGSELRVAEKSNDAVLIYQNIFSGPSGDIAPDTTVATSKPESLVEMMTDAGNADVSDSLSATAITAIAASSNPGTPGATSGEIHRFDTQLGLETTFDTTEGLESMTFDLMGDAYATYDDGTSGGIMILNRVATQRDAEQYTDARDRKITGAATGLVAPKGLDVSTRHGLVFVAENNASSPGILIFSSCAAGDVSPILRLNTSDNLRPWDVDYDETTDSAYVAMTNGTVAVYDNLMEQLASGSMTVANASRIITPTMGGAAISAPTNLHGIDYDPARGSLLVTDVGDAASASDGKLYVFSNAMEATGLTEIDFSIAGPASQLGNPVDIMFDGSNVYLAEKSNNMVMRFDNVLASSGGDIAADSTVSFAGAESVALIPQYLAGQPGE